MFYPARSKPSPETINQEPAWEFYAGKDGNGHNISAKDFAQMTPLFQWPGHCGATEITYDAPLRNMCGSFPIRWD